MPTWYRIALIIWIIIPLVLFPVLVKIRAPYGRHVRKGWGPMADNHWVWFWMELPALLVFPLMAIFGPATKDPISWILIAMWSLHYINRALIYPFRLRTKGKKIPVSVGLMAVIFNLINGGFNGYYIGFIDGSSGDIAIIWMITGLVIFISGFLINNMADSYLIHLRKNGNSYQIPKGRLFEYISCPNHFGEILEWLGFAIFAMNPAAWSFAIWTFCNLAPRARNHHQWYREYFREYPADRKAVIPFVW